MLLFNIKHIDKLCVLCKLFIYFVTQDLSNLLAPNSIEINCESYFLFTVMLVHRFAFYVMGVLAVDRNTAHWVL